jgi:2'-5' RNA ligase
VEEDNLHMTLKFLGEVEEKKIEEINKALGFLQEKKAFQMTIYGAGVFPNPAYVRVIWAGVREDAEETRKLQGEVDAQLLPLGFPRDDRFHPHFTLARVRSVDKGRLKTFLQENATLNLGSFTVSSIELMESRLGPKGPAYSIIRSFPLS